MKHRLKLTSLKFISAVDRPAQETATALLIKRAPGADGAVELESIARVVKTDEKLGIVFGWAMTPTADGQTYYDLHGDAIDEHSMLKVAAEFMAGKRVSDVMHDESSDGTVVFGMPLTAEIAKAFGIETDTTGLMVGIKPSPEVLKGFLDGTYTGFSIGGTGIREDVKRAAADRGGADVAVMKRPRLTSDDEGHAHLLDDGSESGMTSGADMHPYIDGHGSGWHYHPFVRSDDGAVTIGAALGHTHTVGAAAKRAPQPITTQKTAPTSEKTMDPKILKAIASLTADQLAHLKSLPADEHEAFLGKSASERAEIVTKALANDPEIEVGGRKIRKSQDPTGMIVEAWKAAEAAQAAARQYAETTGELELEKRVGVVLKHFGGELSTRKALLRAVEGIADETTRKAVLDALVKADGAIAMTQKSIGFGGGDAPEGSAQAALDAKVAKFAADHKVDPDIALVKLTGTGPEADPEARALYERAQAERAAN